MTEFRKGGLFAPHLWAAPKKPIQNRVKTELPPGRWTLSIKSDRKVFRDFTWMSIMPLNIFVVMRSPLAYSSPLILHDCDSVALFHLYSDSFVLLKEEWFTLFSHFSYKEGSKFWHICLHFVVDFRMALSLKVVPYFLVFLLLNNKRTQYYLMPDEKQVVLDTISPGIKQKKNRSGC